MKNLLFHALLILSPFVFCQGGGISKPAQGQPEDSTNKIEAKFRYEVHNIGDDERYLSTEATGETNINWEYSCSAQQNQCTLSMRLQHHPTLYYKRLYGSDRHPGTICSNGLNLLLLNTEEHYITSYPPGDFFNSETNVQINTMDGESKSSSTHSTRHLPFWVWAGSPQIKDFERRLKGAQYLADTYLCEMHRTVFRFEDNCPLPEIIHALPRTRYQCRTAYANRGWFPALSRRKPYWQLVTTTTTDARGKPAVSLEAIIIRFNNIRILWISPQGPFYTTTSAVNVNPDALSSPEGSDSHQCLVVAGEPQSVPCVFSEPLPPLSPILQPFPFTHLLLNNQRPAPASTEPSKRSVEYHRNQLTDL